MRTAALGCVLFRLPSVRTDALLLDERRVEHDAQVIAAAPLHDGGKDVDRAGPVVNAFIRFRQPLDGRRRHVRVAALAADVGERVAT